MQIIREIIKVSNYRPLKGLKGELYKLVQKGKTRKEAIEHFEESNRSGHFRVVYKDLKDNLLQGVLNQSFAHLSKVLYTRFKIWKKELQTKILLQTENTKAGVKLAIETIALAEKYEEIKVVENLTIELMKHYVIVAPDAAQYRKYETKLKRVKQQIADENKAELVYYKLIHSYRTKAAYSDIKQDIEQLAQLAINNEHYRFRYFFYSIKNIYYQLTGDTELLINNNRTAYYFFDAIDRALPYSTKFNFLADCINVYLIREQFAEAANAVKLCLALPKIGSFNWHNTLLKKAQLNFYTQKPNLTLQAYQLAQSEPQKFNSDLIRERWHLIEGYLALYAQIGSVGQSKPFKLSKWLNITEKEGNKAQKSNIIIITLLYHLFTKNYPAFLERSEQIEYQITRHFKGHDYKRTRYFLRMLRAVVKGNYRASLVSDHAAKNFAKLVASGDGLEVSVLDREVVRYEILWDMVLKQL